jgi:molecular chaperone GrpE (heat shock protein)
MKTTDLLKLIKEVQARVSVLQSSIHTLEEQLKNKQNDFDSFFKRVALKFIEILDLIEIIDAGNHLNEEINLKIFMKKIQTKLMEYLEEIGVEEIKNDGFKIDPQKIRVLETRECVEKESGSIIEVCRKGYSHGERIIRSMDVITVKAQRS